MNNGIEKKSTACQISCISGELSQLSTGDRAELRRGYEPYPAAFWRLTRHIDVNPAFMCIEEKKWYVVIQIMALLSGAGKAGKKPHTKEARGIGQLLAANDYSENRLLKLLSSEGDSKNALLIRAIRFLKSNSVSELDCVQIAEFVFAKGDTHYIANGIARDYYKIKNKKERTQNKKEN